MGDFGQTEVQEELQEYLNYHNINGIFVNIVETLLVEKPGNPISYMIDFLSKEYPDEVKESDTFKKFKLNQRIRFPSSSQQSTPMSGLRTEISINTDETDSEEDNDENNEYLDARMTLDRMSSRVRRNSVSAESFNTDQLNYDNIKKIKKSNEESERILKFLNNNMFLQYLDHDQMNFIKDVMFKENYNNGDIIIEQGEDGNKFYLLDTGSIDVYIKKENNNKKKVATYGPGDTFGELAVMYNSSRQASCIATSDVQLWALDRNAFKRIMTSTTIEKRNLHSEFLEQVPLLSDLDDYERMVLADALIEEIYPKDSILCREGEDGNKFWIIKEGIAICKKTTINNEETEVSRLSSGSYFGEVALLTTKSRQATVYAETELKVLSMERSTFNRVMGPLNEILNRNMSFYNLK